MLPIFWARARISEKGTIICDVGKFKTDKIALHRGLIKRNGGKGLRVRLLSGMFDSEVRLVTGRSLEGSGGG